MIKVNVSKTELKKFKITQENCDDYNLLAQAGHVSFDSEYWASVFMAELEKMNIWYTVTRSYQHVLAWQVGGSR